MTAIAIKLIHVSHSKVAGSCASPTGSHTARKAQAVTLAPLIRVDIIVFFCSGMILGLMFIFH